MAASGKKETAMRATIETPAIAGFGPRPQTGNELLDALPETAWPKLRPLLRTNSVVPGSEMARFEPGVGALIHFPLPGTAIAELVCGPDGDEVELALTGFEGFAPVGTIARGELAIERPLLAITHGTALTLPVTALRESAAGVALTPILKRFALRMQDDALTGLICNGRHTALQRLARWILRLHDRVGDTPVELSHETLSRLLGVRRATVTVSLHTLAVLGAIQLGRRTIRVIRRDPLESAACWCYRPLASRPAADAVSKGAAAARLRRWRRPVIVRRAGSD